MVSMTPDQSRKVGVGFIPTPSPFFTPRPERERFRGSGFRGSEARLSSVSRLDRDLQVNVQVVLRCRPLNEDEQRSNPSKVITCNDLKREVVVSQSIPNKQIDRVFTFDKVFGPKVPQRSIYEQAIAPIVRDVLDGYDCTVFAYGQTGTGKTYTMEGGMRSKSVELGDEAGVIPRAVRQIFDMLEAQNADYSMKVSSLELYNEEITDLLAREDNILRYMDDKQKKSVSLMEDGKGCVVIRGLEEEVVYSSHDIFKLLERGASKRRTSDTLLNKRSSRSHSIFTIMVHVKETIGEEELIKCGKLNLVDLAGSENVSRSGMRESRAREAGEINKSLLTLGRVINALVDHSAHIPYRETKTCIIATISPSGHCLEETLSTLDYVFRAKNIKNKPEANQKMSKSILLKELYMELERMKQDVRAARGKNGVYISHERFVQDEAEKKGRIERIEQLERELEISRRDAHKYRHQYICEQEEKSDLVLELQDCKEQLEGTSKLVQELEESHKLASLQLQEKDLIISKLLDTENSLIQRSKEMRSKLEIASEDITALHTKIDEKNKVEALNHKLVLTLSSQLDQSLKDLQGTILVSVEQQQDQLKHMDRNMCSFLATKDDATKNLESKIQKISETHTSTMTALREFSKALNGKAIEDFQSINATIASQTIEMEKLFDSLVVEAKDVLDDLHNGPYEKNKVEALNHKLVLTLSSQLDQSLKDLQGTILVSVEQQQDQLKHMDRNMCSFLATKDDATKNLESKIQKISETHTSTMTALREFSKALNGKAIEDFQSINATIASQTIEMEKLFDSLVVEAKDVLDDLHNSFSMQKELLAFSAMQQEQGLQRTLVSSEVITKAAQGFFDDICSHVSELIGSLENSQSRNHNYLINFEQKFKEESVKEEKQAIEKIVSALATLTTNKTALVSQTLRNINETRLLDDKACRQNLSKIQEVSLVAKNAMNKHMESVESHFLTDLYLLTEMRETKNELFNQCYDKVNYSREQWKRAQDSLNNFNNQGRLQIQSFINEKLCDNERAQDQHGTSTSAKDAEFNDNMSSLLLKIKDSFTVDYETKNKMNTLSSQCLNQLTSLQTEHNTSLSTIQKKAEQCLTEDYRVDCHAETLRKVVQVPSLASIEEMRTSGIDVLLGSINLEERFKYCQIETKSLHSPRCTTPSFDRAPFANIN